MAKRKAEPSTSVDDRATTRPRTRSTRSVPDAQVTALPTPRRGTRVAAKELKKPPAASSKVNVPRKTRNKVYVSDNVPPSVVPDEIADESSEDELILSPSKNKSNQPNSPPPRPVTSVRIGPRIIMDSVEITSHPKGSLRGTSTPVPSQRKPLEDREDHAETSPPTSHAPHPAPSASPHRKIVAIQEGSPTASAAPSTSPMKRRPATSSTSRSKLSRAGPSQFPRVLSTHLHPCLSAQKRAILAALQNPPIAGASADEDDDEDDVATNVASLEDLSDLIRGTVDRGEGNSCLLIGPRSTGKTRLIGDALASLRQQPIIIRLSGHVQTTDRLAMREIARQVAQQTGTSFPLENEADALGDIDGSHSLNDDDLPISLPPPSHLPALISVLPTLKRPSIVILDAFDLFALHPRQSLLYCLLDTAQSCRVGKDMHGIAILGVTSRVDTINLLEKRVKSRFSGRMLRTAGPRRLGDWINVARSTLTTPIADDIDGEEWTPMWNEAIEQFLADSGVKDILNETFALTRDVRILTRILTGLVLELTPTSPFPSASHLSSAVAEQRCPPRLPFLPSLPYPSMCLLIAAVHVRTSGHDVFTFEMLHESFRDQVRTSLSAPVQIEGGGIGMVKCSREVLMSAFENMVKIRIFVSAGPSAGSTTKEFCKYRCMAEREDVKKAVDKLGQTSLKKWFSKAQ